MRFLADENFPAAAVRALLEAGHDVAWVMMSSPGISDQDVLAWAVREGRILLTFDKDFGELARHSALPSTSGAGLDLSQEMKIDFAVVVLDEDSGLE